MRYLNPGIVAILLAASLIVTYDRHIRADGNAPTPDLVAKQLIPKGTPANLVRSLEMSVLTALPRREVQAGAISNLPDLSARRAAVDIFPGEQLSDAECLPQCED